MPRCIYCHDYFCDVSHGSPAQPCECGACVSVEDARRDYFADREPTEDELEERRRERQ